jgi:hypothetical protein
MWLVHVEWHLRPYGPYLQPSRDVIHQEGKCPAISSDCAQVLWMHSSGFPPLSTKPDSHEHTRTSVLSMLMYAPHVYLHLMEVLVNIMNTASENRSYEHVCHKI